MTVGFILWSSRIFPQTHSKALSNEWQDRLFPWFDREPCLPTVGARCATVRRFRVTERQEQNNVINRPPMTGNDWNPTYKNGDKNGGMVNIYDIVLPTLQLYQSFIVWIMWDGLKPRLPMAAVKWSRVVKKDVGKRPRVDYPMSANETWQCSEIVFFWRIMYDCIEKLNCWFP